MRSKTCTEPNPTKPPTHHTKPQIIVKNSHPIFKNLVTTRGRQPTRKNKSDKKSVSTIMNNNYKRIVKVITTSIGLP